MRTFQIHPAVGVARVGNAEEDFYLAPEAIGGRPIECDEWGNAQMEDGHPVPVRQFKDKEGRVRRQGALFRLFATEDDGTVREVTMGSDGVESITWTVHLANKKAAWYSFSELQGNLLFGPENSYEAQKVPLRNKAVQGEDSRRKLIIDPGPRIVAGKREAAEFDRGSIPATYPFGSFPEKAPTQGLPIDTLGGLRTDDEGRLIVLGGFGHAGGDMPITGFGGADTWHDDIADGPVTCTISFRDAPPVTLTAWCVVGSPKFAPELVNPVSLDDIVLDQAVRYHSYAPEIYGPDGFNADWVADFDRDVGPILYRMLDSIWVANVPTMAVFAGPRFDPRDPSEANRAAREGYFRYFRRPDDDENQLWSVADQPDVSIPLMPVQSNSNSVSNVLIQKFLTLTPTQYFILRQWSAGKFRSDGAPPMGNPLDRASVGNCVGGPMCPGIEVTWSTRNPTVWDPTSPYRLLHAHDEAYYAANGLSPSRDETEPANPDLSRVVGAGCEPGDLTKRMAIPWQADFFQCTYQEINFTDPNVNKANGVPVPPTFYGYWWPPQSPMFVISGYNSPQEQAAAGVSAGTQVFYARGINSYADMINAWSYLGFIVNQNEAGDRGLYPYFVERERNHSHFTLRSGSGAGPEQTPGDDPTFAPVWNLVSDNTLRVQDAAFKGTRAAAPQARPIASGPGTVGRGAGRRSRLELDGGE